MTFERFRKWLQTIALILIGFALIWANATVNENAKMKKNAITTCQRNVEDRKIQQSGHRRLAQAWRVAAASAPTPTLSREYNAAADRHTVLAAELDPLIKVDCGKEFRE